MKQLKALLIIIVVFLPFLANAGESVTEHGQKKGTVKVIIEKTGKFEPVGMVLVRAEVEIKMPNAEIINVIYEGDQTLKEGQVALYNKDNGQIKPISNSHIQPARHSQ